MRHRGIEAEECCPRHGHKDYVCFCSLSDVRPGYCYTALTNGRCSNQLPQSITKMQCCCDVGRCWSPGVTVAPEMCPIRSTGKSPSMVSIAFPMQPFQAHGSMCSTDPNDTQVNQQDSRNVKCGHGGIPQMCIGKGSFIDLLEPWSSMEPFSLIPQWGLGGCPVILTSSER